MSDEQDLDRRKILFSGEMQLLKWSESHSQGAQVVLQLADADSLEVFKKMTTRHGKIAGQRLAVVMCEIGTDEQLVDQKDANSAIDRVKEVKGGALSRLSGQWCQMPMFHKWLQNRFAEHWQAAKDATQAAGGAQTDVEVSAMLIRRFCYVESRAMLDQSPKAAELFHKYIRIPFAAVLAQHDSSSS